jgi:hypothetical protein
MSTIINIIKNEKIAKVSSVNDLVQRNNIKINNKKQNHKWISTKIKKQ